MALIQDLNQGQLKEHRGPMPGIRVGLPTLPAGAPLTRTALVVPHTKPGT